MTSAPQPTMAELIQLCAVDNELFNHTFFPSAARMKSPLFAERLNNALDNPNYHFLNLKIFRGGTKTTRLRMFAGKRIAYGISRTILYVGASEDHAKRSISWLRNLLEPKMGGDGVERKSPYAETFQLTLAKKGENEIRIEHGVDKHDVWVVGVGITGNIRGINFDNYRPDLILLDDVITDESAATPAQREKLSDLIMGAVANSLRSRVEEPNAKLVMLQTPLDADDASGRAERSTEWHTEAFGCWTEDTKDLPVDQQESSWPEMFPTETLRKQKTAAVADNRYSVFAREMECKLVSVETSLFHRRWLRTYDQAPAIGTCVIAVDPVPPPSPTQMAKGLKTKDFEAISVVARSKGDYYLLDYALHKGHEPDWTTAKIFEFVRRYRPQAIVLETVAAQRYLKWFLEKEMSRKRVYVPIKEVVIGGNSKFARINAALSGVASQGKLYVSAQHTDFITQFESYGVGYKGNDDLLESVANGVAELTNPYLELVAEDFEDITEEWPGAAACP